MSETSHRTKIMLTLIRLRKENLSSFLDFETTIIQQCYNWYLFIHLYYLYLLNNLYSLLFIYFISAIKNDYFEKKVKTDNVNGSELILIKPVLLPE